MAHKNVLVPYKKAGNNFLIVRIVTHLLKKIRNYLNQSLLLLFVSIFGFRVCRPFPLRPVLQLLERFGLLPGRKLLLCLYEVVLYGYM